MAKLRTHWGLESATFTGITSPGPNSPAVPTAFVLGEHPGVLVLELERQAGTHHTAGIGLVNDSIDIGGENTAGDELDHAFTTRESFLRFCGFPLSSPGGCGIHPKRALHKVAGPSRIKRIAPASAEVPFDLAVNGGLGLCHLAGVTRPTSIADAAEGFGLRDGDFFGVGGDPEGTQPGSPSKRSSYMHKTPLKRGFRRID